MTGRNNSPLHIWGYHKTTRNYQDSNHTVLFFYAKNKIKQRIYNKKLINQNTIRTRKDEEL